MAAKRSSEAPQPTEAQPKPVPEVKFLLTYHSMENLEQVVKGLEDADVVLVEYTNATDEEKREIEKMYNLVLRPPESVEGEEAKQRQDLINEFSKSKHFWEQVVHRLAGTGKEVHLVDITREHPVADELQLAEIAGLFTSKELRQGNLEKALKAYKFLVEKHAASSPQREQHIARQVKEVLPSVEEGKKVTVVQGLAHGATRFRAQEILAGKADLSMHIDPDATLLVAARLVRLKGALGVEFDEDDYRMGFLADLIFKHGFSEIANPDTPFSAPIRAAVELAGALTPEEIEEAFNQYPEIYNKKFTDLESQEGKESRALKETAIEMAKIWAKKKGIALPQPKSN